MDTGDAPSITVLLHALRDGDAHAMDAVFALAYERLRAIVRRQMARESTPQTLTPTELVNEAYLKLCGPRLLAPADREHFFAIGARAMRQVLVERARSRNAAKRDAGERVTLSGVDARVATGDGIDLMALDQALDALANVDARKARAIELRVFGGLEFDEIARQLGVSRATLARDYRAAEAFLRMTMDDAPAP